MTVLNESNDKSGAFICFNCKQVNFAYKENCSKCGVSIALAKLKFLVRAVGLGEVQMCLGEISERLKENRFNGTTPIYHDVQKKWITISDHYELTQKLSRYSGDKPAPEKTAVTQKVEAVESKTKLPECKKCGNKISPRACKCPKCGEEPKRKCIVCNVLVSINSKACPSCGDPEPFGTKAYRSSESKPDSAEEKALKNLTTSEINTSPQGTKTIQEKPRSTLVGSLMLGSVFATFGAAIGRRVIENMAMSNFSNADAYGRHASVISSSSWAIGALIGGTLGYVVSKTINNKWMRIGAYVSVGLVGFVFYAIMLESV